MKLLHTTTLVLITFCIFLFSTGYSGCKKRYREQLTDRKIDLFMNNSKVLEFLTIKEVTAFQEKLNKTKELRNTKTDNDQLDPKIADKALKHIGVLAYKDPNTPFLEVTKQLPQITMSQLKHLLLSIKNIHYICNEKHQYALLTKENKTIIFNNTKISADEDREFLTDAVKATFIKNQESIKQTTKYEKSIKEATEYIEKNGAFKYIKRVQAIYENEHAFVVLFNDETADTWLKKKWQGFAKDAPKLEGELKGITEIIPYKESFAAYLRGEKKSRSVLLWSSPITTYNKFKNVKRIFGNEFAHVILFNDQRLEVVRNGNIYDDQKDVDTCALTTNAIVARLSDGTLQRWNIKIPLISERKVEAVFAKHDIFVVLLEDGTVRAYGEKQGQEIIPKIVQGKKVRTVKPQKEGFTFILRNGDQIRNW